jgi:type I restriction enzyme, R subunit
LVAFSGTVKYKDKKYTEINLNNIEETIEKEFDKPEYRFLIVANKFQYGFNQPYLQTMFLDKSVSGINAVQTISRLNRVLVGKNDTLVVDFTDSYKEIIAAFRKFKGSVEDFSSVDVNDLPTLQNELLSFNIFTKIDINDFKRAIIQTANPVQTTMILQRISNNLRKIPVNSFREFRSTLTKFNSTFRYLENLFRITSVELRDFALFTNYLSKFIDPIGKGGKLDEELKKVHITSHIIRPIAIEPQPARLSGKGKGVKRTPIYTTIPEVIEVVNVQYEMALGNKERNLFEQYVAEIINNPIILNEIRANKVSDLDTLYKNKLSSVLKERAINFFLTYNPSSLFRYIEKDVLTSLNEDVFRLAVFKIYPDKS